MPTIRPYRADDWDAFLKLDIETGLISRHVANDEVEFRKRWPEFLKTTYAWTDDGPGVGEHLLRILETDDGRYAGHLWLTAQKDFFTGQPKLYITTIAVADEYRGRGFGEMLMKHAIGHAQSRGYASIGLGVDATNSRAIGLYEKLGFETARLSMELAIPV
jgi:ribosomal protein S18 acetylase RimI-like enzyme